MPPGGLHESKKAVEPPGFTCVMAGRFLEPSLNGFERSHVPFYRTGLSH